MSAILALWPVLFAISCSSRESVLEEPPIITSATQQHTQYNGRGQPVEVIAARDNVPPFIITYFKSEEDLDNNTNGTPEAPAEVGDYYARVERPAGNGYRQGKNIKIEYHLQKAFIAIIAEPVQRFSYDGNPKEALVQTEPPSDLVLTYFTADGSGIALPSPPSESYLARIVFPGNERYMGASKEVELLIE